MAKKKKILFINRVYPPHRGATGRMLKDLAHGFAQAGWQVSILTTGKKTTKLVDGPVTLYLTKSNARPRGVLAYLSVLFAMFMRGLSIPKHHVVVSLSDPPLSVLLGDMLARNQKAKHIHWCQDLYPDLLPVMGSKIPKFLLDFSERWSNTALQKADKVIAIGRCMADRLIKKGVQPAQITYLPNWPDREIVEGAKTPPKHLTSLKPKNARDAEDQIKGDLKFRVLYAGNIGQIHPIKPIIEAAIALNDSHPDIEFTFVGGGKMFDQLASIRSQKGLDNIRLIPFQPFERLLELAESGDLHILCLKDDAKGMAVPSKIYTAIAAQRPAIYLGPQGSEVDQLISDYHLGTQVRDTKELVQAIRRAREDADFWFSMHQGAIKASEVYLPQNSIEAWIKRAESVLD